MTRSPITAERKAAILDAAWEMIRESGSADISPSAIAARAGVSRQTVYLAFGNRAGLLTAMVRNQDRKTHHVGRLRELANGDGDAMEDFLAYVETWLDYLPIVYPVAIHLDAAAVSDHGASQAWDSRTKAGLLTGMKMILGRVALAGGLRAGLELERAAEAAWAHVHLKNWRLLVVECGWSPEEFRTSRVALIRKELFGAE